MPVFLGKDQVRRPDESNRRRELVGSLREVVRFRTAVKESRNGVNEKSLRALLRLELINL